MKEESKATKAGKSLKELAHFLSILFVALRACEVTTWSWFWVLSPIFATWALSFVLLAAAGIIACIAVDSTKTNK